MIIPEVGGELEVLISKCPSCKMDAETHLVLEKVSGCISKNE
jgi:hypothetical protein